MHPRFWLEGLLDPVERGSRIRLQVLKCGRWTLARDLNSEVAVAVVENEVQAVPGVEYLTGPWSIIRQKYVSPYE